MPGNLKGYLHEDRTVQAQAQKVIELSKIAVLPGMSLHFIRWMTHLDMLEGRDHDLKKGKILNSRRVKT
jgi:hypothetical protein